MMNLFESTLIKIFKNIIDEYCIQQKFYFSYENIMMNPFESMYVNKNFQKYNLDESYCINTGKALLFVRKSNDEYVRTYVDKNFQKYYRRTILHKYRLYVS